MAAPSAVVEIKSKAQFDELIKNTPYVALQAHAAWCGPCKAISPIFNKQAAEHKSDKYTFAKFDTDDVPDLAHELGIRSIPAFFFFENGDKASDLLGAVPPKLIATVKSYADKATGGAAEKPAEENALKTDENF
ncbi:thioredoxin 1 [Fusarium tjaetaba]|uniref:Thioredoxin 1 n=1 Tax=Fusarium tjaetaba TaxID=1567544 RepID=A0A8H5RZD6_9HYPO|nr:thioredoxin 1 [Fusarium tjaetaba]KAF5643676.1 thioredoxin 1 [Fusarium tjaetaba]